LREDAWNLWFVVTAPDAEALASELAEIAMKTGLRVLDLRLVRPFHIDLGFSLNREDAKPVSATTADLSALRDTDRPLLQALSAGLPLMPEPYAELARRLNWSTPQVMQRIKILCDAGLITRLGIIVRHRQLGWTSNAMVVWDLPLSAVEDAGQALAALHGVSLCYHRRTEPDVWPYPLYNMVHARSRNEALAVVASAAALPQLKGARHKILFSTHCYKQAGALLLRQEVAA
jgi:DNA-binding Lrp family transcriptional regulator